MKTNPAHVSARSLANLFTRLRLAWVFVLSVLAVRGANTVESTGPLSIARSGHTTVVPRKNLFVG